MLLAKIWDKISAGMRRNIPASTPFLSPRELELTRFLLGDAPGLHQFGGYPEAERKMLVYLPDYLEPSCLMEADSPAACLRCEFYHGDSLSHRDFLGALMGAGIARETVGDICVDKASCDFFVTAEIAPYLLTNFDSAGRSRLRIRQIPLGEARIPEPEVQVIRDTLASLRLDSVVSSGFRMGRSAACEAIRSERACVNGLVCAKPDRLVSEGDRISVRGMGKIQLAQTVGQTKKGRISVILHRYM